MAASAGARGTSLVDMQQLSNSTLLAPETLVAFLSNSESCFLHFRIINVCWLCANCLYCIVASVRLVHAAAAACSPY